MYHALGQLASMISLGAGPVSFTHIVKAMEPFFSAIVSGVYFHKWMPYQVYATLIPVVCGVGYACLKELNFSWLAFGAAMASNLFFALRAVMSKLALQSGKSAGTNLSAPNMFGLVTWAAFIISIPLALIVEARGFPALWSAAVDQVESVSHFLRAILLSGLFHYLNNEVMYLALGSVHPVTLAVGNTMKRVFILVASVMVFRNPISLQAGIGSGVGIAGVLLYSLTKQYYESLESASPSGAGSTAKVSAKKWSGTSKVKAGKR
jgi:solute carrier family 35 protein E1